MGPATSCCEEQNNKCPDASFTADVGWALGSCGTAVTVAAKQVVRITSVSFPAVFCISGTGDEHYSMRGHNDTVNAF